MVASSAGASEKGKGKAASKAASSAGASKKGKGKGKVAAGGEFLVAYFPYVDPTEAPKAFKCRVVSTHRKLDVAFLELENATPDTDWMPVCAGPTKLGSRLFSAAFPHLVDIAFLESDDHDVQIHTISPIVNDFPVAGNAPTQGFFGSYFCNLNSSGGPIFSVDAAGAGEVHGIHTEVVWGNIRDTVMPEDDEIPSDDKGRDEMLRSILPQVVDRVKGIAGFHPCVKRGMEEKDRWHDVALMRMA